MKTLSSSENLTFKNAVRLHSSRGRRQQNRIIVFGAREVSRCMEHHQISELFVSPKVLANAKLPDVVAKADRDNVSIFELTDELFEKLNYGQRSDGVVAVAPRPTTELQALDSNASLVVVVDSIEKPGNLGAIVRSADAAGADAVISVHGGTDFFHPNSIRNSMGTVFSVPLATGSLEGVLRWLTEMRLQVLLATVNSNSSIFFDVDLCQATAMVLGNEASGLSEAWTRKDEFTPVSLPMLGLADSLNVSVTASIMLYEALRQRSVTQN